MRAVVLTGEGESFCAGGDLDWMRQQFEATRQEREAQAMKLARMLRALNELPKPLIGRVNGQAFGGGLGMMSVCDVAIAADSARFAFTETRLGLIPATIAPYVVARMGEANARRVFMSARMFDAQEASRLGLVAKVVPAGELDTAIAAETKPYLSCSPQAVPAGQGADPAHKRKGRRSHDDAHRRAACRLLGRRCAGRREGLLRKAPAGMENRQLIGAVAAGAKNFTTADISSCNGGATQAYTPCPKSHVQRMRTIMGGAIPSCEPGEPG